MRKLRKQLGLLQSEFAARLSVSRTQVVAWEGASGDLPSTHNLLELAKLAPEPESQLWFFKVAGVDLGVMTNALGEQLRTRLLSDPGRALALPIIRSADELNGVENGRPVARKLLWPTSTLPHPDRTVALIPQRFGGLHADQGFIVVDRSENSIWRLFERTVAVHFDSFPVAGQQTFDFVKIQRLAQRRPAALVHWLNSKSLAEDAELNGFFAGRLRFRFKQPEKADAQTSVGRLLWYVGLKFSFRLRNNVQIVELSTPTLGDPSADALTPCLKPGFAIIGEVIGWTKSIGTKRDSFQAID